MNLKIPDKWKYGIFPGFFMHFCIGAIYSWSVLENQLVSILGYKCTEYFSYFTIIVGLTALIFSPIVEKRITLSSWISTFCLIIGIIGSYISYLTRNSEIFAIFFLGFLSTSIGIGYLVPIKNILLWSKERVGLVIGISLLSFSMSRGITALIFSRISEVDNPIILFIIYSIVNILIMILCSLYQKAPKSTCIIIKNRNFKKRLHNLYNYIKNIIFLPKIWTYWNILFFGILSTSALLSSSRNSFSSIIGLSLTGILFIIGILMNTIGRLTTSLISDKLNDPDKFICIIMYINVVLCMIGFFDSSLISFIILSINFLYGALFTIIPLALYKRYGYHFISGCCGLTFLSWTLGHWVGNYISFNILHYFPESTFKTIMLIFIILYFVGLYYSTNIWERKI